MHTATRTRLRTTVAVTLVAGTALAGGAIPALAAGPTAPKPDPVALMQDFTNYWQPSTYDQTSDATKAATVYQGTIVNGRVLGYNDKLVQAINHAGAASTSQSHRALIDADYDWTQTYDDAFGPVLSRYFDQGIANGSLPKTKSLLDTVGNAANTGSAKPYYNFPRPYIENRFRTPGIDLKGLSQNLDIRKIADWTDSATGKTHTASYDSMASGYSQAFPSGHTTYAYTTGIALATLLPQLAPEIVTRASEAGNNRIVLGVHYPLDVEGGRILGEAGNAYNLSDPSYVKTTVKPAQRELARYLTKRCKADRYGSTLTRCIDRLDANDRGGYTNSFTDAVSKKPVTNRKSALKAYEARLTYSFKRTGAKNQPAIVPEGAESLLVTAFPQLTAQQRRAVLAKTEIASGYPLDSSSEGYQRLDLAAAYSAQVTLDSRGRVVKVQPGQDSASVVVLKSSHKHKASKPSRGHRTTRPASHASRSHVSRSAAPTFERFAF